MELTHTGTESHNSLGQGETYHSLLRRVYKKVSLMYPTLSKELRLSLSVKAMNDTAGPNRIVPSPILLGEILHIPHMPHSNADIDTRMQQMRTARREYENIVVQSRVRQTLQLKSPEASIKTSSRGQPVYVYREKKR